LFQKAKECPKLRIGASEQEKELDIDLYTTDEENESDSELGEEDSGEQWQDEPEVESMEADHDQDR